MIFFLVFTLVCFSNLFNLFNFAIAAENKNDNLAALFCKTTDVACCPNFL